MKVLGNLLRPLAPSNSIIFHLFTGSYIQLENSKNMCVPIPHLEICCHPGYCFSS